MRRSEAARLATWSDRLAARMAGTGHPAPTAMRPGLPRSVGSVARGEAMLGGLYRMGGHIVDGAGLALWDAIGTDAASLREAHGFGWLDDLAAVPSDEAAAMARAWTAAWVERFGAGRGPGWTPDLAGQRALRLVHHAGMLAPLRLAPCLARHVRFLSRRVTRAAPGLPQVEALAGLVHAALALDPRDERVADAFAELEPAADVLISRDGSVPSRSPEALARAILLLGWTVETAVEHGRQPGASLAGALSRGVPVLRSLVQPDGCLPRFHGGDAAPGLADAALAAAAVRRPAALAAPAMGYARLRHGRASVVIDAAPPPVEASDTAHASTLAIEITVGRTPMIVSCGPGERYGARWARASRATAAHSTLSLDELSSSRLGQKGRRQVVRHVRLVREDTEEGTALTADHDGYVATHGLHHERAIELSRDGRSVSGVDVLAARDAPARRRLDRVRRRSGEVRFAIRFHIDPAVEASLDMGGRAISLLLPSGGLWVFRATAGEARLSLEASVVFPRDALEPVGTRQMALFSSANEYATRIAWKLAEVPGGKPLVRGER